MDLLRLEVLQLPHLPQTLHHLLFVVLPQDLVLATLLGVRFHPFDGRKLLRITLAEQKDANDHDQLVEITHFRRTGAIREQSGGHRSPLAVQLALL